MWGVGYARPAASRASEAHMTAHAMTTTTSPTTTTTTHTHAAAATTLADLTESIRPTPEAVERLFNQELSSDLRCVNVLVKHVSRFRGKMLRPCLVLMSGPAWGVLTPAHTVVATVGEMVHIATLVHDDVLDDAE